MKGNKIFVDSNVLLYLFSNDAKKKQHAASLLSNKYYISTQVVNENVSVCLRKLKLSKDEAFTHATNLLNSVTVLVIYKSTIKMSFHLSGKYGFSFWDSLIVATALENDCDLLLSEDMQHNLIVESKLTIQNPFAIS
jgi:predicted nucleic acid-binding protein